MPQHTLNAGHMEKEEAELLSLRAALTEGESSGPSTEFDFDELIAAKTRGTAKDISEQVVDPSSS
jgi:Arc/MetJ-type ribon-helix-helix transcriptional regulator